MAISFTSKYLKNMNKYTKTIMVAGLCAAFAIGGAIMMSPTEAAKDLSDAASISLNNEFTGTINQFPSIRIGKQGIGGVTFFNGTIVNTTTSETGADNPVTFGDDVRIDGKISRGEDAEKPVWIEGGLKIEGDVEGLSVDTDDLSNDAVTSDKIADGAVAGAKIAADGVGRDQIGGPGGANLPIAYGYVTEGGSLYRGTSNVSVTKNTDDYLISVSGYDCTDYRCIAVVTPAHIDRVPMVVSTPGSHNYIVVSFENDDWDNDTSPFYFVIYKI